MSSLDWFITAAMRQNLPNTGNLAVVTGVAHILDLCLAVQWAWISLPAALLGLEVVFLVAVIFMTRRAEAASCFRGRGRVAVGGGLEEFFTGVLLLYGLEEKAVGEKPGKGSWRNKRKCIRRRRSYMCSL